MGPGAAPCAHRGAAARIAPRPSPAAASSAAVARLSRRRCRCRAASAAAAASPDPGACAETARRVAYNRARHERDRANRRARVQAELAALSPDELAARRDAGRREAERRRDAVAAAAAAAAAGGAGLLTIAIDCSYAPDGGATKSEPPAALSKAVRSLAKQLELSAAANKRSARPAALHATSFSGPVADFAGRMGAGAWPLFTAHAAPLLEVFPPASSSAGGADDGKGSSISGSSGSSGGSGGSGGNGGSSRRRRRLVVLSPDAAEPLDPSVPLDRDRVVYVIGGIVDRTVRKGLTLAFAERHGLEARRLPVAEMAAALGRLSEPGASKTPVLNVSDVVACLLAYDGGKDWAAALGAGIPARKLVAGVAASSADGGDEGGGGGSGRRSRRRAVGRELSGGRRRDEEGGEEEASRC
jgi:tRNA (guanine9-N1)-methyltransferase